MKLLKNKNYMLLWLGQNISQLGTRLYDIALMWYMYNKTGSSIALGLTVVCFTVPSVLTAPLAGVFADRHNKKKIIINTNIINGIIMLIVSYIIFMDNYPIFFLYILMILSSIVAAAFNPAMASMLPLVVEENDLKNANTLNQLLTQIINILGPALAGILIAFMNIGFLFFLNGLSFLICAIIESFMIIPKITIGKSTRKISSQFKEGLIYVMKDKRLFYLLIAGGVIINFFSAPLTIYETILSNKILNVGSTGFGMMNSALSIGALTGALLIMVNVFNDKYKMTLIGLCLNGLGILLIGIPNYYIVLGGEAVLGVGAAIASIGITTLYQTLIPKDKMGRVMSLARTLCEVTIPLGTLMGSTIAAYLPLYIVLTASGIFVLITGISLIPLLKIKLKTLSLSTTSK